jgi:hypothetical protein
MPRVIVVAEAGDPHRKRARSVLLDEEIVGTQLDNESSSVQFLERLAWAISDAERAESRFKAALGAGKSRVARLLS